MAMEALGRLFDAQVGVIPQDMNAGAATGKWVSLTRASGLAVVFVHAVGASGAGDPVLTLQEAKDNAGTSAQNLAVISKYYKKSATTLAGTESWTEVTQAAAATITAATGEGDTDQALWVFHVFGIQLSAGFEFVNVSTSKVSGTSTAELGTVLYFPYDLEVQRTPANLTASGS